VLNIDDFFLTPRPLYIHQITTAVKQGEKFYKRMSSNNHK